jgi:hypothetical protein
MLFEQGAERTCGGRGSNQHRREVRLNNGVVDRSLVMANLSSLAGFESRKLYHQTFTLPENLLDEAYDLVGIFTHTGLVSDSVLGDAVEIPTPRSANCCPCRERPECIAFNSFVMSVVPEHQMPRGMVVLVAITAAKAKIGVSSV